MAWGRRTIIFTMNQRSLRSVIMWSRDLTRSVEMEEDKRGETFQMETCRSTIFIPRKTWKWVFLFMHNVICRHTEIKGEGKKLSNSWNLSCSTFSHTKLHISTKPRTKIKPTVPSFLTDHTEIINKLYMKHCEEKVENQTIRDTQSLNLLMLCWFSCC